MGAITEAFYDVLVGDDTLVDMLSTYEGEPAVFTTDPPPDDATLPYIVSAGEISTTPFDTKIVYGRRLSRDVRMYAAREDSALTIEAIAERVRALFHRQVIAISGFVVVVAECMGPIQVDEDDAHGRIVTVWLTILESTEES